MKVIDRNKILKGLEVCSTGECGDCPYNSGYSTGCFPELTRDALTILNDALTKLAKIADIVE